MRSTIWVVTISTLCLWSADAIATEAQTQELATQSVVCMQQEAKRLDDGVSDPLTVAIAVKPMCEPILERAANILGDGLSYNNKQYLLRKLEKNFLENAVGYILTRRKH